MSHDIPLPKPPLPTIDSSTFRLPGNQYVNESVDKTGIVLHHTVSSSVESVYNWWLDKHRDRAVRVGTAYVIGKDGTIYEFFPPECWAWHLGKDVALDDERRTIGIELVSEGALVPADGEVYAYYNASTGKGLLHNEDFVDLGKTWRGYRYFDDYSSEQIMSTIMLVDLLCDQFDIPRQAHTDL